MDPNNRVLGPKYQYLGPKTPLFGSLDPQGFLRMQQLSIDDQLTPCIAYKTVRRRLNDVFVHWRAGGCVTFLGYMTRPAFSCSLMPRKDSLLTGLHDGFKRRWGQ